MWVALLDDAIHVLSSGGGGEVVGRVVPDVNRGADVKTVLSRCQGTQHGHAGEHFQKEGLAALRQKSVPLALGSGGQLIPEVVVLRHDVADPRVKPVALLLAHGPCRARINRQVAGHLAAVVVDLGPCRCCHRSPRRCHWHLRRVQGCPCRGCRRRSRLWCPARRLRQQPPARDVAQAARL